MRRAAAAALTALALAAFAGGCGGDDEGSADRASPGGDPAPREQPSPSAVTESPTPNRSPAAGASGRDGEDAGEAAANLATDPQSIPAARVTPTGAVQTLPPRAEAHRVAQRNSYSSIKAFGAEAEGEEATEITFAVVQYFHAKASGDWATACARLYSPLLPGLQRLGAQLAGGEAEAESVDCPAAFAAAMRSVPASVLAEQAKIDVSSVRREGDRAFVIYKTPETLSADMPLYLEDGVWKVAAIDPYTLAPGQAG